MDSILFTNALIIPSAHDKPRRGALLVRDGRIAAPDIGFAADRVIDCRGGILMSALHNTHSHAAMTLLRGVGSDLPLQKWLFDRIFPIEEKLTPDIVRTGTQLAMLEMLRFGTASFADSYFFMNTVCQTILDSGMKANIAWDSSLDNQKGMLRDFWHVSPLLNISAGIHSQYTSSTEYISQISDFARENALPMQIHISETRLETDNCIKEYGKTPARVFADAGAFDHGGIAAHCVYLSDEDVLSLNKKGVYVSHCPISNLKLASGIMPLAKYLNAGMAVTIGTDGCASNNTLNLFEELRMCALLQKGVLQDAQAVSPAQVLAMATTCGARANGFARSGELTPGADADIVLIDTQNTHSLPMPDPISHIAYCAQGSDVRLTMVAGRILYEYGEYTTLDKDKIMSEAACCAKALGVI